MADSIIHIASRKTQLFNHNLALSSSHPYSRQSAGCKIIDLQNRTQASDANVSRILIYQNGEHIYLALGDILYCRASGNYTEMYMRNRSRYLVSKSLKSLMQQINSSMFIRCHQSYLINKAFVQKISRDKNIVLVADDNRVKIPISRRRLSKISSSIIF